MLENIELFGNSLGTGTYPDGEGKSFLQNIFDIIHPIGEVYIQYPAQKSPQEIYNKKDANNRIIIDSVWEEQLQYNSAFFRSEHLLGSYVYKANDETQYYLIDNLNNLTPINIEGNSAITIAGSPTSGQQKIIGDKTYQAYAVSGVNNSSSDYIKEGNPLSIQAGQNKNHTHTLSHTHNVYLQGGSASASLSSNRIYFQLHSRHMDTTSGEAAGLIKLLNINGTSLYSGRSMPFSDHEATNNVDRNTNGTYYTYDQTVSINFSHSNPSIYSASSGGTANTTAGANTSTTSNGTNCGDEVRTDNYTYRIWKRIS